MAKKDKKRGEIRFFPPDPKASPSSISKRGWRLIGLGLGLSLAGFVVLSFTDPRGQNWASRISPFLIVGGYASMAVGLLAKDPSPTPPAA